MLSVTKRNSPQILRIEKKDNALFLFSENTVVKLEPKSASIVWVLCTNRDFFSNKTGLGFEEIPVFTNWTYTDSEEEIILSTEELDLSINKKTASFTYMKKDGSILLKERSRESRILEKFDSYKIVVDDSLKVEKIETADGEKQVIRDAKKVLDKELYHTKLFLDWQEDEALFGMGQAEEGIMNLRNTTKYLHQGNMKIAIPFLLSTKGYGILSGSDSPAIFHDDSFGSFLYTEAVREMDFYFIEGENFDALIKSYRYLTGKAVMLPAWAFGYWQSQERYETQEEILKIANAYRERDLGIDCLVLDWQSWSGSLWGQKTFDEERFPDVKKMTNNLHDMNIAFSLSIWPTMNEYCSNYKEFQDAGLFLPASNIYDAFKKEGRDLYWNQIERGLFSKGVDSWWCDSSEPITPEWSHAQRSDPSLSYLEYVQEGSKYMPAEHSNAFGLVHAQGIYEGQRGTGSQKRVVNLTRSGYTGQQRYGVILWSGDISGTWDVFKKQIPEGLNLCASGLPYWTLDIGGFFVKRGQQWFWDGDYDDGIDDLGYQELYTRWFQYASFLPVFRGHGTDVRREMWMFGNEGAAFYDALLKANRRRYELMPYIYSLAGDVWKNDGTMLRMLAFDFANDKKALQIKDQFMLGKALMVCPVTEPMYYTAGSKLITGIKKERTVYLPSGADWYDFITNKKYTGGQTICVPVDISDIPVFVKAGSILPVSRPSDCVKNALEGDYEIRVYPGKDSVFELYEDARDGYSYENGEYALTEMVWDDTAQKLDVKDPVGEYVPPVRIFSIMVIRGE